MTSPLQTLPASRIANFYQLFSDSSARIDGHNPFCWTCHVQPQQTYGFFLAMSIREVSMYWWKNEIVAFASLHVDNFCCRVSKSQRLQHCSDSDEGRAYSVWYIQCNSELRFIRTTMKDSPFSQMVLMASLCHLSRFCPSKFALSPLQGRPHTHQQTHPTLHPQDSQAQVQMRQVQLSQRVTRIHQLSFWPERHGTRKWTVAGHPETSSVSVQQPTKGQQLWFQKPAPPKISKSDPAESLHFDHFVLVHSVVRQTPMQWLRTKCDLNFLNLKLLCQAAFWHFQSQFDAPGSSSCQSQSEKEQKEQAPIVARTSSWVPRWSERIPLLAV